RDGSLDGHAPTVLRYLTGDAQIAAERDERAAGAAVDETLGNEICRETLADAAEIEPRPSREAHTARVEVHLDVAEAGRGVRARRGTVVGQQLEAAVVPGALQRVEDRRIERAAGLVPQRCAPLEGEREQRRDLDHLAVVCVERGQIAVGK